VNAAGLDPARELTGPVALCDAEGRLNPEAAGWSRRPLHGCNLRGAPLRKKRWSYWCVMGENALFSPTIANIDYAAFGAVYFLDYAGNRFAESASFRLFPRGFAMPDTVAGDVTFERGKFRLAIREQAGGVRIEFDGPVQGRPMRAAFDVARPEDHDTLNVVVPWSARRFQFTSKQTALPAVGEVRWGGETHVFAEGATWATLDYGRGVWPYRTVWNWAAAAGRCGGHVIGLNLGAQWTTGTGATENGVVVDGHLHKLHEDVVFTCDPSDFTRPWRLRSAGTDAVDLEFTPFYERHSRANLIVISARGSQCFGHFTGTVRAGGQTFAVDGLRGWAEECRWRW
jgi:hypothetical protein